MMKLKIFYVVLFCCVAQLSNAQVLFTETFDNLALGELSTDFTGATPGKGGWYVTKGYPNNPAPCEIVPEAGRGNVLAIGANINNVNQGNSSLIKQKNIDVLWNNRTAGNNVLKMEYDVYLVGLKHPNKGGFSVRLSNSKNKLTLSNDITNIYSGYNGGLSSDTKGYLSLLYYDNLKTNLVYLGSNNTPEYNNFPYNNWFTVELFIDYNYENGVQLGGDMYVNIPALNIVKKTSFSHNEIIEFITLLGVGTVSPNSNMVVKYDNIKLTALSKVPLSVNEVLATQFNLYPNPATNLVNINSVENKPVNKIAVYDVAGKLLSTQSFNNETQIQLNTQSLASGTYILHIQTNNGTAVKKLVKR